MDVKVIGQVDDKFISILTKDNFLMLLDQHAVDERIRLEKIIESKKYRNAKKIGSQITAKSLLLNGPFRGL